ncbi:MAG: hypothetical protein ABI675_21265 [Chitinophagaceae bacterium]
MKKIIFLVALSFLKISGFSQDEPGLLRQIKTATWWTPFAGIHILPDDVYVTGGKPGIGYGSGHFLLWQIDKSKEQRVWLGFDFNHHYFGRIRKEDNRVFFEHWQFAAVTRFSFYKSNRIEFFSDFSLGIRSLASFTSHNKTYTGVFFNRLGKLLEKAGGNFSNDQDDYILKKYERLDYFAGLAAGFVIWKKKNPDEGLTIRCAANFGNKVRYVDRRLILSENETIDYPLNRGRGMFFNVQVSHTIIHPGIP